MRKRNKFNSRRTTIDGITFDSKREAEVYCDLKHMRQLGSVKEFSCQPEFKLQEGFYSKVCGKKRWQRPISYFADFCVVFRDGSVQIWDVKGRQTEVYRIKKKLLLALYPEIDFWEVK